MKQRCGKLLLKTGREYKLREAEIKRHLVQDIIPFWKGMKDLDYGGFYGEMDYNLKLNKNAVKGGILNSRILWFFANAYAVTSDAECLNNADHAYEFLKNVFYDKEHGGIYWSVTYDGLPLDNTKHTYNQAFAVYGLASYYGITQKEEALELAYELVRLIEDKCRDTGGYLEAFDREFKPVSNEKLSENGIMADRTMNTLLHVFEAYTELYRVDGNEIMADRMRQILDLFACKVYNQKKRRLEVFFDEEMNSILDLNSYGHDIEAAWLLDRGCEILGNEVYTAKISTITRKLTARILEIAYDGTSLYNECCKGELDTKKVWWVQSEAIVGFLNGFQKSGYNKYKYAACNTWDFVKNNLIDKRAGSEWLSEVDRYGKPYPKEIVGPWKCPYHNGRMCFEVIKRNEYF